MAVIKSNKTKVVVMVTNTTRGHPYIDVTFFHHYFGASIAAIPTL